MLDFGEGKLHFRHGNATEMMRNAAAEMRGRT